MLKGYFETHVRGTLLGKLEVLFDRGDAEKESWQRRSVMLPVTER